MLRKVYLITVVNLLISASVVAQSPSQSNDFELIPGVFLGKTAPVKEFATEFDFGTIDPDKVFEIPNFKDRYRKSPVERNLYPRLDPLWKPNQGVATQRVPQTSLLHNYDGINYTGVQPPDPCLAASPDYVVQMINGSGGAKFKVWNKNAGSVSGTLNFDNLFTGYNGLGDPIVLFDQLANRWFLSEFSSSGNRLLVAVSETNDPMGSYYTYVFQTQGFPDYPKYSIWPNAYYCTANESNSSVYAFERDSMLVGAPANLIRKFVVDLNGFGFQTLTPVNFEGTNVSTTAATFWRHVDDEAHYSSTADPFSDWVEYWTFSPDFSTPSNSTFTGPTKITVSEFDSDLNGYFQFAAIEQPNTSVRLDPLREVFMNRMNYRNFGIFESIVGCHVTDIDGSDWAGMRWYEFRKTDSTNWTLYQEGTYAPDSNSRWMGAIDINANGSICMAYSISSDTIYPSLRYTGRNVWDPLGVMTITEQTISDGAASNGNNRYGDYASMTVDPADDSTFWFTGEYNPFSSWRVRIAHIQLTDVCGGLTGTTNFSGSNNCPGDSNMSVTVLAIGGNSGSYQYSLDNVNFQSSNVITNLPSGNSTVYIKDGTCTSPISISLPGPDAFITNYTSKDITCNGDNNGEITTSAFGGTGNLEFSIDNTTWGSSSSYTSLSAGVYTVYIRDAMNCLTQIDSIEIIEPTLLVVTDSIIPATSSTSNDGEIYLDATGGTPPYTFSMNGVNYSPNKQYVNLAAGTYVTYAKDSNLCAVTGEADLYTVSVKELFTNENIRIYPNPTSGVFKLELGSEITQYTTELVIRDVTGKIIFNQVIESNTSNYIQEIDISKNAKGMYFLSVSANNETKTIKIVLEN